MGEQPEIGKWRSSYADSVGVCHGRWKMYEAGPSGELIRWFYMHVGRGNRIDMAADESSASVGAGTVVRS
jgi:hypothetical protein